jgi:uncharacterized protein
MNEHLKQLIDLAQIDKEIDAFEPQIEEVKYQYESVLAGKENLDKEIVTLEEEIKADQIKKNKNEMHLSELAAKLEENKKKSSSVKTEREMKSLQLEEEIAKEQISFANDEIARLDKLIQAKEEKINELGNSKQEAEGKLAEIKSDVDTKLAEIDKERQKVFDRKEKLMASMNQKGLVFYQKIRRWAKNTTAVEIRDQACMGCYMTVNDKVYADVIKGEEITLCPHCGRILYLPKEQKEEA